MKEFYIVFDAWGEYFFKKEENAIEFLWKEYTKKLTGQEIPEEISRIRLQLEEDWFIPDFGEIDIREFKD